MEQTTRLQRQQGATLQDGRGQRGVCYYLVTDLMLKNLEREALPARA